MSPAYRRISPGIPHYWQGWAGPHADEIVVDYINEPSTIQLEMESDQLVSAVFLPDNIVSALATAPGVTALDYPFVES